MRRAHRFAAPGRYVVGRNCSSPVTRTAGFPQLFECALPLCSSVMSRARLGSRGYFACALRRQPTQSAAWSADCSGSIAVCPSPHRGIAGVADCAVRGGNWEKSPSTASASEFQSSTSDLTDSTSAGRSDSPAAAARSGVPVRERARHGAVVIRRAARQRMLTSWTSRRGPFTHSSPCRSTTAADVGRISRAGAFPGGVQHGSRSVTIGFREVWPGHVPVGRPHHSRPAGNKNGCRR